MASNNNIGDELPGKNGHSPRDWGFSKFKPSENGHAQQNGHAQPVSVRVPGEQPKRRKPVDRKFNLSEIIKAMYRGRWIVLTAFVIAFIVTVYSTYSKPYIYSSTARLFIDRPPGGAQVAQIVGATQAEDHSTTNEIQFFKSHIVSSHVARLLHEYAQGNRYEIDSLFTDAFHSTKEVPPDPRQIAIIREVDNPKAKNRPGVPDTVTLEERAAQAVTIAAEGDNDYLDVSSEAYTPLDAAFIVDVYIACFVKDDQERVRANSTDLKNYLFSQKERSFDTLKRVENQLRDYLGTTNGMSAEEIAKSITDHYQDLLQKRQYIEVDLNLRKKMYSDYTENLDTVQKNYYDNLLLEPNMQELQKEVTDLEFDIQAEQMSNNIMDPRTKKYVKDEVTAKKEKLGVLEGKLKEVTDKYLKNEIVVANEPEGENTGTGVIEYSTKGSSVGTITTLRQNILNTKLRVGQDSTLLVSYDEKLAELHAESSTLPDKIVETTELTRAQEIAEKMYGELEDRYLQAWMTEESVFGKVRAEDAAQLNAVPIRPNRQSSILTGSLLGLAIGMSIVVLLSLLDSRVRTPEEVESHNIQLLATVPAINPPSQPLNFDDPNADVGSNGELQHNGVGKYVPHKASHLDPRSSVAETFRTLRTTILFAGLDRPIQVLALSSSAPQEGKSTTSANLAIVMSQMGKKTLIIDADLRRPVQHSAFSVPREPGLTNLLFDRSSFEEAIKPTEVPNLWVLPCGIIPPNPAELLGSNRMHQLIDRLREEFDFILLDTPPVVAVTDALLLGHVSDATVLIARAGQSRIDAVLRAMDAVERSGANLLGVVLNDFNPASSYGSYYKYYQYYQYSPTMKLPEKWWDIRRFIPKQKTEV
ncbi:MAG TPA: polysaccharide biosynthesis tyrosine autokinase [Candidatus Kapabacteria bacterium]|jgi:tyrosine-protein kinase Etk/Wzc